MSRQVQLGQEKIGANRQVCMIAMAEPFPEELVGHDGIETFATIWLHLDAIP
jgi:hypothetical protein